MKQTLSYHNFKRAFVDHNRGDNFSAGGLRAIYEYFEEIDPEYELCVVDICCEFCEFSSFAEYQESHNNECKSWEEVGDLTTVLQFGTDSAVIMLY